MSHPQDDAPSPASAVDATLLSNPTVGGGHTHSSLSPKENTSAGETRPPEPLSTVVGIGSQLGPYQLLDKLGEGGMGAVYKARHTRLDKLVALKILPQHVMSRPDALARFDREMKAVGKLHHPNVVQAHDAGEVSGVHYLSMEYVEGQDLQELVKAKGPMSVVNACKAIRQAALGLAAAHKLGLVHRDIKPSNLFVTKETGQIKILDMGLALLSEEQTPAALTSTGQCFGTPDYMAPEQWEDAHTCDARADLYALGCTLFLLLAGRTPYGGDEYRTVPRKMMGHVRDPIPDLKSARAAAVGWTPSSDRSSGLHSSPPSSGERRGEGAGFKAGPLTLTLSPEDGGRGDKTTDEGVHPTSDIPDGLDAIYRKLMAKEPKDRFASADQLAEALAPFTRQGRSAQSSPHAPREESRTQIDSPKRSGSDTVPAPLDAAPAPAIVSRSETATLGKAPVDPLDATSTWNGDSDGASPLPSGNALPPGFGRKRLLTFGGAAALVLLGVIIITITNKDGTKTKIEVPGDSKVEITTSQIENQKSPIKNSSWHGWPADAPKPAVAPFDAAQAKKHQEAWAAYLKVPVEYTNPLGMKFRLIPPGEFTMGSSPEQIEAAHKIVPPNEKLIHERINSEAPQHKVILTQPIYLGANEVTQAEYEKVMGVNPAHFAPTGMGKEAVAEIETTDHPVETVSWNDAAELYHKLSKQEKFKPFYFRAGETITPLDGTGYRLPNEAEWENACRAGTTTKFWSGDKDEDLTRAAWFGANSGGRTHAVGELEANPFGLNDIHGNVWEFVQDGMDETYYSQFQEKAAINPIISASTGSPRGIRGSNFLSIHAIVFRSSARHFKFPNEGDKLHGFRVALPVDAVRESLKVTGPAMPNGAKATASKFPPLVPGWFERVSKLPPEEQVKEVSLELKRRNPEWDEKLEHVIRDGQVYRIYFDSSNITDIMPLAVFTGLRTLNCNAQSWASRLADLSPLAGMKSLSDLSLDGCTELTDISPLRDLPIEYTALCATAITDLSPLAGKQIHSLNLWACPNLTDLSPLKGAPLDNRLQIHKTNIRDLSPIRDSEVKTLMLNDYQFNTDIVCGWPLKSISFESTIQKVPREKLLRLKEIKTLETIDGKPVAEFWKEFDKLGASKFPPLAPGWFERVSKLPPEEQVKEVSLELKRRNPEWDEKLEHQANGLMKSGVTIDSSHVADITPLSVLTWLNWVICTPSDGKGLITDLSPLVGLKSLVNVTFHDCRDLTDISSLRDLPVTYVDLQSSAIADLSPLTAKPITFLNVGNCKKLTDLSPIKGAPLETGLLVSGTGILDLSPVKNSKVNHLQISELQYDPDIVCGWPLKDFALFGLPQNIPREMLLRLKKIKTLETINFKPVAEFWKEFDQ